MDCLAELLFDRALAFGGQDLPTAKLMHVEAVYGRAALGANLGTGDVQVQVGQGPGNGVEEANAVFGFDLDDGPGSGGLVVEEDLGRDVLAGVGGVKRAGDLLAPDQGREINFLAGQGLVEDAFEAVALVGAGEVAGEGVGDEVVVQDEAVGAGEDLGGEDVESGGGFSGHGLVSSNSRWKKPATGMAC